MKPTAIDLLSECAGSRAGVFSTAVAETMRNGAVQFVDMLEKLRAAGLTRGTREGRAGFWCEFRDADGHLRANGYSQTEDDAILYAILGAVREEHAVPAVDEWLAKVGFRVDDKLRAHLQGIYIKGGSTRGGEQALEATVKEFRRAAAQFAVDSAPRS